MDAQTAVKPKRRKKSKPRTQGELQYTRITNTQLISKVSSDSDSEHEQAQKTATKGKKV